MANHGFKVLDSDMHILEPADLWQRYIDKKFKHLAPVGTTDHVRDLTFGRPGRQRLGPARRSAGGNAPAARPYFSQESKTFQDP